MAKVVRFDMLGGPSVLHFDEMEIGEPGRGEVRLRVESIGLNRAETLYRRGEYIYQPSFPSLIGYEGAGVIEAIGASVDRLVVGDKVSVMPVFAMNEYGIYGEQAIVPAKALAHIPEGLSFTEAAALWMPFLTAYGALVMPGRLAAGDTVLLTAGSSSVALAAVQIARREGLETIVTTRSRAKRDVLARSGADHVVITGEQNLAEEVDRITSGKGAKLIFDPVGGPNIETLGRAVSTDGQILVYGSLDPRPAPVELFPPRPGGVPLKNGAHIRFYTVHEVIDEQSTLAAAQDYIVGGIEQKLFSPTVGRVFRLDDVVAAHEYIELNQQVGKIVLNVERR